MRATFFNLTEKMNNRANWQNARQAFNEKALNTRRDEHEVDVPRGSFVNANNACQNDNSVNNQHKRLREESSTNTGMMTKFKSHRKDESQRSIIISSNSKPKASWKPKEVIKPLAKRQFEHHEMERVLHTVFRKTSFRPGQDDVIAVCVF